MSGKQIALITGAGSGIGRAVAVALARAGFSVTLAGRRQEELHRTAELCAPAGESNAEVVAVPTDVTEEAAVDALFATIERRFGRLDVLFNNAGISKGGKTIDELSVGDWQSVVDVNLTGSFLCARGAFRLMRRQLPQGGRIINNGSISAHAPRPLSAPYTATKHAITGLTKSISLDGRPFDIACSQIDIGNAATEMTARMQEGVAQADGTLKPEPRMDVDEVAAMVVYMARLPLSANVQFATIMATKMPFIGRG